MLKPKRRITRKEIKRDPFLETIDKLENSFEKNKKTFLNIFLGLLNFSIKISGLEIRLNFQLCNQISIVFHNHLNQKDL